MARVMVVVLTEIVISITISPIGLVALAQAAPLPVGMVKTYLVLLLAPE